MNPPSGHFRRLAVLYLIIVGVACAPIWWVDFFVNQDGSGHLYSAYIMGELVKGGSHFSDIYALNSFAVPNSSGHWIMAVLCQFFSPFVVTKIMVTVTYAGIVFAAGWLRVRTAGWDGIETSLLIGATVAFNWLWLVGFYNFTLGVIVMLPTLGLYYHHRERFGFAKGGVLFVAFAFVYFSHVVSFMILAGGVGIMALLTSGERRGRTVLWTFLAFVPVVPLFLAFRQLNSSSQDFSPVWRGVDPGRPVQSWLYQIRAMDPFILISRKTLPFTDANSDVLAIFTPMLWIGAALTCIAIASFQVYRKEPSLIRSNLPFLALAGGSLLFAAFGPDDFNLTNGSVLRERFFIVGILFLVPLVRNHSRSLTLTANLLLVCVLAFQTIVLWDYSLTNEKAMWEFRDASQYLKQAPSSAMIVIGTDAARFHADPLSQANCYNGIGNQNLIWDNYELGHYLFPLVAKSSEDKRFIFDLTRSEHFPLASLNEGFDEKLDRLESVLSEFNGRIDTLAIAGSDPRIEALTSKWFEAKPYFEEGRFRLFRHR